MNTLNIDPNNPPAVHEWEGPTGKKFRDIRRPKTGFYFHDTTDEKVIEAIETAFEHQENIRLFYGDTDTGRDWMEEHDLYGKVGRSTGWKKTALICHPLSDGGPAILADCVVKIIGATGVLYRHPLYKAPSIIITENSGTTEKLPVEAFVDGSVHARFSDMSKAYRWKAFMLGQRINP